MITVENLDYIFTVLIAAAPALTTIIGCITTFIKMKNNNTKTTTDIMTEFEKVRKQVEDTREYENLKAELAVAHQENRELKKKLNELLTKIDRVARNDEE